MCLIVFITERIKQRWKKHGNLNSKNGYGISYNALTRLNYQHRAARNRGDIHQKELIEYRLTDINFHHEVGLLVNGKYKELLAEQKVLERRI